jgi:GMP synthase (glutamine-hydrolysing)
MSRLLLLELGTPRGRLPDHLGDFVDWIRDAIGPHPLPVVVLDPRAGELPEPRASDVIITTGASGSTYAREPWSERAGAWLLDAIEADLPILGICYGHQLLAQVLGGRVARDPGGPELGTYPVRLLVDDPLFDGMRGPLPVHQAHFDAVVAPPPGAVILAGNERTPIQAMALGDRVRTVQWHPEFFAEATAGYVRLYRDALGPDFDRCLASVQEPAERGRLLRNFLRHFAGLV